MPLCQCGGYKKIHEKAYKYSCGGRCQRKHKHFSVRKNPIYHFLPKTEENYGTSHYQESTTRRGEL